MKKTKSEKPSPTDWQAFSYYLKDKKQSERSVQEHLANMELITAWAKETGLAAIAEFSYNDLVAYAQYLKGRGLLPQTINNRLSTLTKYYTHLQEEGLIEKNPAKRLRIKGTLKRVIVDQLSYGELESLYYAYVKPRDWYYSKPSKKAHQKNMVILGLMIWQGLHSGELEKIRIEHVKAEEGIIYVPSSRRSNSRELKLEARQVIGLYGYLNSLPKDQEKLFPNNMNVAVKHIIMELQAVNPLIRNAQHIRASVIMHWIKMYNKRQVQYMIGHRYISSMEYYEAQELETLTDQLMKHHPFG